MWSENVNNDDLLVKSLISPIDNRWDNAALVQYLPTHAAKVAIATPIYPNLNSDTPIWPFNQNGSYPVKSGYKHVMGDLQLRNEPSTSNPNNLARFWKEVWEANVQPKIKFFIWKVLKGAIATRHNLWKKKKFL